MANGQIRCGMISFFSLLALAFVAAPAHAQSFHHKAHHHYLHRAHHYAHMVFMRPQPASFIVDAETGKILESENADAPRYPASLTKMMTLYLTFDALKRGTLRLDQTLPVSAHAASQPQTNIALRPGERIAVKDAIFELFVERAR